MMVRRGHVGFTSARHDLLQALFAVQRGEAEVFHDERRPEDDDKNQLKQGTIAIADVVAMVKLAQGGPGGRNYAESDHHDIGRWPGTTVHALLNIKWQGTEWYVKWFFDENDLFFISVHEKTTTQR